MLIDGQLIEGIFKKENKNRFICLILINDALHECYVPNSSRMEKYLDLINCKVLVTINKNINGRTKYSLFAVKYRGNFILLNLNLLNSIVKEAITDHQLLVNHNFRVAIEQTICGYKTDVGLFDKTTNEIGIVEVKGIISADVEAFHPKVYSKRSITQLEKLKRMLLEGFKVYYYLIVLSPTVKIIRLDYGHKDYCNLMEDCIDLGIVLQAFSIRFKNRELKIDQEIPIVC